MSINLGVLDIGIEASGMPEALDGMKQMDTLGQKAARGIQQTSNALKGTSAAAQAAARDARRHLQEIGREAIRAANDAAAATRRVEPVTAESGRKAGQAFVRRLKDQLRREQAEIKEEIARGLLTPAEAAKRGEQAARSYNNALLREIKRQGDAGALTGAAGAARYVQLAGSLRSVEQAGARAGGMLSRLREPLQTLAYQAVGTNASVGALGSSLGMLALGSGTTLAVLGGIAAVGYYVNRYIIQPMRDAKKATQEALDTLRDLRASETPELTRAMQIGLAQKKELELRKEVAELEEKVARDGTHKMSVSNNANRGLVETSDSIRLREARKDLREVGLDIAAGQRDLQEIRRRREEEAANEKKKQADEAERALREAEQAIVSQIGALTQLHAARRLNADEQRRALAIEDQLLDRRDKLARITNKTAAQTEALADAESKLASIQEVSSSYRGANIGQALTRPSTPGWEGVTPIDPKRQSPMVKPKTTVDPLKYDFWNAAQLNRKAETRAWLEQVDQLESDIERRFTDLAPTLGGILGDSLGAAFEGGIGNAGDVLLKALGGLFKQMGSSLISYGITMMKLLPALSNPFTSGPAALIAGAALVAIGGTLSGIATGSGGRGGSAGSGGGASLPAWSDRTSSITLGTPSATIPGGAAGIGGTGARAAAPSAPVTNQVWLIGPNDPTAARQLKSMMDRHAGRSI